MACGCAKNRNRFRVVVNGKVVFVTSNEATANGVAARYPGGVVEETVAA